ncbi:MAG: thiamine phosphate synthase [Clostridiaceae bacterium]
MMIRIIENRQIYLITNRKSVEDYEEFLKKIDQCTSCGVEKVILREKDLQEDELLELAVKVKEITDKNNGYLIINSNIKVAKKIKAYGVHLPFRMFRETPKEELEDFPDIGVSAHTLDEAIYADRNGASYVIISHIFSTDCKKGLEPKGTAFIKDVKESVKCRVVSLGGILPSNIEEVMDAGSDCAAVMSTLMKSENIHLTLERYGAGK